jgi:hypothetical protein
LQAKEIDKLVDEASQRLFQIASAPIRYYILSDLWGRPEDNVMVQRALEESKSHAPRVKLLEKQRADGTWPIPSSKRAEEEAGHGPPYGWTYMTMLRNLNDLTDYLATKEDGHIETALEKILSWQTDEGYIPGPWDVPFPLPQFNGHALRMLLKYGMERDSRVRKLSKWLVKMQRPDGGWRVPYLEDVKYKPEYKFMRRPEFIKLIRQNSVAQYDPRQFDSIPSCIWSTLMVVRGFSWSVEMMGAPETRRGAEFFLNRFFQRNYHSLMYQSSCHWTKLRDPNYIGNGLCALDILTWIGFGADDPRMDRPISWLYESRSPDGLWNQTDRPQPNKDESITEIALGILSRYSASLKNKPFGYKTLRRTGT